VAAVSRIDAGCNHVSGVEGRRITMRERLWSTVRGIGSRLAFAALLAIAGAVVPAISGSSPVSAADPIAPAPHLIVDDGPFTRNPDVKLGFVTYLDVPGRQ
jgi:hypothetical protein